MKKNSSVQITLDDLTKVNDLFDEYLKIDFENSNIGQWRRIYEKIKNLKDFHFDGKGLVRKTYEFIGQENIENIAFLYSCKAALLSHVFTNGFNARKYFFTDLIKDAIAYHMNGLGKIRNSARYDLYRQIEEDPRFWEIVKRIESLIRP